MYAVIARSARRFAGNAGGVGAVEFAIVAPLLLLLYMGGIQLTIALTLSRKVNHIAAAIGDLVAQNRHFDAAEIDSILAASRGSLAPYSSDPLGATVTGIKIDAAGRSSVVWTRSSSASSARAKGEAIALPEDLNLIPDSFIVVAETSYDYTPIGGFGPGAPYHLTGIAYYQPRVGGTVECADC